MTHSYTSDFITIHMQVEIQSKKQFHAWILTFASISWISKEVPIQNGLNPRLVWVGSSMIYIYMIWNNMNGSVRNSAERSNTLTPVPYPNNTEVLDIIYMTSYISVWSEWYDQKDGSIHVKHISTAWIKSIYIRFASPIRHIIQFWSFLIVLEDWKYISL